MLSTSPISLAAPAPPSDPPAHCDDRFRGHALTEPEFFHGDPAQRVEDIPDDKGWIFDKWKQGAEDVYLVCNYGLTLAITQRVQRGATACLFPIGKGNPVVVCR